MWYPWWKYYFLLIAQCPWRKYFLLKTVKTRPFNNFPPNLTAYFDEIFPPNCAVSLEEIFFCENRKNEAL